MTSRSVLTDAVFVRNVIFGVEDSLVSTVGLLSGIATDHATRAAILSTGVIYICVEALSMAVGSFLSEESAEEFEGRGGGRIRRATMGGMVMLVSFVIAGFVPIIPYLLFAGATALPASIALSLVLLFALGFMPTHSKAASRTIRAIRMVLLGGTAIVVGVVIGSIFGIS